MTFGDQKDRDWFRPGQPVSTNAVYEVPSPEKQKFEEIKRMAEKFFRECIVEIECDNRSTKEALMASWEYAKEFYEFAKEKEEKKDA